MPEAILPLCAAAESTARRYLRLTAGALLVLFALVECSAAGLMVAGVRGAAQLLYLFCSLALLSATAVALREPKRGPAAVRVAAIAAAVMLFWSQATMLAGPSVSVGGRMYGLAPALELMLLASVLLAGLLRGRDPDATCRCQ